MRASAVIGMIAVVVSPPGRASDTDDIQRALHSGIPPEEYMRRVLSRVDEISAAATEGVGEKDARSALYWDILLEECGINMPEYNIHGLWCAPGVQLDPTSLAGNHWTLVSAGSYANEPSSTDASMISHSGTAIDKGRFVRYITPDRRLLTVPPDEPTLAKSTLFIGVGDRALFVDMSTGDVMPIPIPSPATDRIEPTIDALQELMERASTGGEAPTPEHARALQEMRKLAGGLRAYKIATGRFPNSWEALLEPMPPLYPESVSGLGHIPVDPWGNAYQFEVLDERNLRTRVWSAGPNGTDEQGDGDDVRFR